MSVAIWRIALETDGHAANDLSGTASRWRKGRWNTRGRPVVYCSANIALAVLETLSHAEYGDLSYARFLVRVDVPDLVWAKRELLAIPGSWDAIPSGVSSKRAGDKWLDSLRSPLLLVPSVIVPEEYNVLLNPLHPDTGQVAATTIRRWTYDPRLY